MAIGNGYEHKTPVPVKATDTHPHLMFCEELRFGVQSNWKSAAIIALEVQLSAPRGGTQPMVSVSTYLRRWTATTGWAK